MSGYQRLLEEQITNLKAEARSIASKATTENRNLTVAENERANELIENIKEAEQMRSQVLANEASAANAEAVFRKLAEQPVALPGGYKSPESRAIEDKFRSAILENNPAPIELRDTAPRSYYQPGVEARALSTGSPANASMGVGFFGKIMMNLVETSAVMRAGATVITTETGEPLRMPRQTAFSSATLVAEGATIPAGDPTFSQVTLGAYKYAVLITVSNELVADAAFDLEGYLAAETGVALGNALGNDLINGNGSGAPRGVLLDASLGVTGPTGTSTSLGAQGTAGQGTDLVNNLVGSLAEPYTRSKSAAFLTRTGTMTAIRNLKATTGELVGNEYINGSPYPFYVDPFVPTMAANAKSILFGDWSRYVVRMVNGIRFEQSREYAYNTDQTVFRAVLRADGALVDTSGAIKHFVNSAT